MQTEKELRDKMESRLYSLLSDKRKKDEFQLIMRFLMIKITQRN